MYPDTNLPLSQRHLQDNRIFSTTIAPFSLPILLSIMYTTIMLVDINCGNHA